ncbi:DUF2062 domain-containing protein [Pseudochrobactrum algeriensis]|uniref:DUF2062 domain-containing protein n=1 Tax=Pseudochrobactrum algeriensis TaxID=2834768 RepID=UPI001BCED321|nr:DUF2062 domain-containing protein [Pseudochrobactrum algeriensis]MBX8813500.1 DUF2062 domain-containing protein [Ochrobactrum sp. MR34]QVQ37651.1 DUF2062 domain-containing protein [Pseudochrobactrum algeriensis]QVQ40871.1 DUF2062 domain-containing protein [Pseudochrobactrum algeriensis]QVQ44795.1 DUF2062 domain-containing protein [Pseudochrobactrum algeriensis]
MLFRRREPLSYRERLRTMIWPRRSFSRSMRYMGKRITRITASPHAVAAGLAVGVFAAFTPFFGFHLILAIVLAYLIAGNIAAAAIGTALANPLTIPFIWGGTYEVGRMIVDENGQAQALPLTRILESEIFKQMSFAELWQPILKPMLFGSLVLGLGCALAVYVATRWATISYRHKRLQRISLKKTLAEQGASR